MAWYLVAGVLHVFPSTPGVFLPWFSVTRFTAKARPENERVSSRCKVRTLFQRPSRVALTIRACSLLTFRSHSCQSVWFHGVSLPEDAHADCSAFICNFLL